MEELEELLTRLVDSVSATWKAIDDRAYARLGDHREGMEEATKAREHAEKERYETWAAIVSMFDRERARVEKLTEWLAATTQVLAELSGAINGRLKE